MREKGRPGSTNRSRALAQIVGNYCGAESIEVGRHHPSADPPRHLVLGAFGIEAVTGKLRTTLAEVEAWRDVGIATDFPKE